jgi:hypothetical protein
MQNANEGILVFRVVSIDTPDADSCTRGALFDEVRATALEQGFGHCERQ